MMWSLQYLLLLASTVAAADAVLQPVGSEGVHHVLETRHPHRWSGAHMGEGHEGSLFERDMHTGELVRRQTTSNTTQFCRFWGHSSAIVQDKRLYVAGGIATFRENYRDGYIYLFSSAIMVDISSSISYPVRGDSQIFSYTAGANPNGESTQGGAVWWDGGSNIYKYGGWFADSRTWPSTPQTVVREMQLWKLDLNAKSGAGEWSQIPADATLIHRAWGGASASVPEKKMGYFLGGIFDNTTDIAFANTGGYEVLGDSFLNFDTGSAKLSNKTYSTSGASELGSIARGNLVNIPMWGQEGILVYLAGMNGPEGKWVPTDTYSGVSLTGMDYVWIYDIANNRWYRQKTSLTTANGQYPLRRIAPCSVAVPSLDSSTWNIFMYGGGDLDPNGAVYGDTWVLSLPSFIWTKVDDNGDLRYEHTCHLVKGNRMLVVGGRDKQQDSAGDPASNYSTHSGDWSCNTQGLLSSLDLNTFTWDDSLPTSDEDYQVNSQLLAVTSGKLEPVGGWTDAGLGRLMGPDSAINPPPGTTTTPTGNTAAKKSTPVGAIAGGVAGGVIVLALIAVGLILLRRSNKKKQAATRDAAVTTTEHPPQPPVAQYDPRHSDLYSPTPAPQYWPEANQQIHPQIPQGYVWDPHSGQYYLPVPTPAPPPQSPPPPGGFYKPQEAPKQNPVGHIAEMEPNPYTAPQELQ